MSLNAWVHRGALIFVCCALACSRPQPEPKIDAGPTVTSLGRFDVEGIDGAEIVDIQARTATLVAVDQQQGKVVVVDVSTPDKPRLIAVHDLGMPKGGAATSIAMHPSEPYYLVAVQSPLPAEPGWVEAHALNGGALLAKRPTGVAPDAVVISHHGRLALVCNEGEPFVFDRASRTFSTGPGSLTVLDLSGGPAALREEQVSLLGPGAEPPATARTGIARHLGREVDWNGNGVIDKEVDFDGDGSIGAKNVVIGKLGDDEVRADEKGGEELFFPARVLSTDLLEPEYAAFAPDDTRAYVVIQEANLVAVLDLASRKVTRYFDLGVTEHRADTSADGKYVEGAAARSFFREPDGIAVSPDGKLLVTCDEGDTDPTVAGTPSGTPYGGGRTISVFDAETGRLLGDTGNTLDGAVATAGAYPDERSLSRGSEPEEPELFTLDGELFAAVSLERADAVALVSLKDPRAPRVLSVTPLHNGAARGVLQPEGLAVYRRDPNGPVYVYTANTETGTLSTVRIERTARAGER